MRMKWQGLRAPKPIGPARGAINSRAAVLRGQKFGAAGKPRRLSDEEQRAVEDRLRRNGQLSSKEGTL
jgi:hypothetical protein